MLHHKKINGEHLKNITNKEVCPRYEYIYLKNINSECGLPEIISKRLQNIGIKSIHPIVDLLNYLMIDLGQPMHAYDADKISGDISIRYAKQNESFKALDGIEYKLNASEILILSLESLFPPRTFIITKIIILLKTKCLVQSRCTKN